MSQRDRAIGSPYSPSVPVAGALFDRLIVYLSVAVPRFQLHRSWGASKSIGLGRT